MNHVLQVSILINTILQRHDFTYFLFLKIACAIVALSVAVNAGHLGGGFGGGFGGGDGHDEGHDYYVSNVF